MSGAYDPRGCLCFRSRAEGVCQLPSFWEGPGGRLSSPKLGEVSLSTEGCVRFRLRKLFLWFSFSFSLKISVSSVKSVRPLSDIFVQFVLQKINPASLLNIIFNNKAPLHDSRESHRRKQTKHRSEIAHSRRFSQNH